MAQRVEDYICLNYTVLLKEAADGSFFAEVAELPGCWAEGKTEKEAREILEEAKRLWIETQMEDGQPIPEPRESAAHVAVQGSSTVLVWSVASAVVNETSERVFSDRVWTHDLVDEANVYIENPRVYNTGEKVPAI